MDTFSIPDLYNLDREHKLKRKSNRNIKIRVQTGSREF